MFGENRQGVDSPIYFGERAFLKLYAVMAKHLPTLFETGSQLIFSNWLFPMWLSFYPKQQLIKEFLGVCNLVFSDIDKFGNQEQHVKSQCG